MKFLQEPVDTFIIRHRYFFHFLDFGMMLYYGMFMLLFPCLMAEAAAFLIILDIWRGYATDSEEPLPAVDLVTKKANPTGFDSNYYYDRYYARLEGKEGMHPKKSRIKPPEPLAKPVAKLKLQDETSFAPAYGGHRQASAAPAPDGARPHQKLQDETSFAPGARPHQKKKKPVPKTRH